MEHLHSFAENNAVCISATILIIAYIFIPVDFIPDVGLPVGLVDDTIIAAILIGVGGRIIYNKIKAEKSGENTDDNVIDI